MARRKKISYKLPPTRMIVPGFGHGGIPTGFNNPFNTGILGGVPSFINNMDRTTIGSNPQANTSGFTPTYVNPQSMTPSNPAFDNIQLANPADKTKGSRGLAAQTAINSGVPLVPNVAENIAEKESVNTFSSEIDPAEKSEFKNEVINEVMNKVEPQNKLEELYKPS